MEKHIESITKLITENEAIKERTPFLDVARGGLLTARENAKEHVAALARQAEAAKKKGGASVPASQP